jgi:8-oxo-dGTP pyrophosphatase MutT (NUDIX family)
MVQSDGMSAGEFRLPNVRYWRKAHTPAAKFVRLSELRRLRKAEQVAAVCYRVRGRAIEFLLVQTRGGRWIFPKGSAEPGLTPAQAAALEAFEEAGVHGRMEEASFARYVRRGRRRDNLGDSGAFEQTVKAYLCEVLWLDPPQELDRRPTWFSAGKAKRRLRDDRAAHYAAELGRVVESAVARIHRRHPGTSTFVDSPQVDSLQKVQFINSARALTAKTGRKTKYA